MPVNIYPFLLLESLSVFLTVSVSPFAHDYGLNISIGYPPLSLGLDEGQLQLPDTGSLVTEVLSISAIVKVLQFFP